MVQIKLLNLLSTLKKELIESMPIHIKVYMFILYLESSAITSPSYYPIQCSYLKYLIRFNISQCHVEAWPANG